MTRETDERIRLLFLLLSVTVAVWFILAGLARVNGVEGTEVFVFAKTWATDLLGLAGAIGGFFGITTSQLTSLEGARRAEAGTISLLAGVTLLGVGEWAVPAALAAFATGTAGVRIAHHLKHG